jgi:hypothetical protein
MLQRRDVVHYSTRSDPTIPKTLKIIALLALAGLAFLFIVSNTTEMPGDLADPTSLYGP